jgi:short subunit dehydrogenase-like uncharacterized protein
MKGTVDAARRDRALMKVLGDPYALSPDRAAEPDLGDEGELRGAEHSEALGAWLGPFVMAAINTRVVRRSKALGGYPYGRSFRYREVMSFPRGPRIRTFAAPSFTTHVPVQRLRP